ncbi:MAG: hypothetical protein ACOX6T_04695 [Myxococcales bacterium]|jgi:hypothetical protein
MKISRTSILALLAGAPLALPACQHAQEPAPKVVETVAAPAPEKPKPTFDRIDRTAFNRAAVRLNLPLYWSADKNSNGAVEPDEVVGLLFYPSEGRWVEGGAFTAEFEAAYEQLVKWADVPPLPEELTPEELQRRTLVIADLDEGRATLIHNDLSGLSEDEKRFVRHMLKAAQLVDELYAAQNGLDAIAAKVAQDEPSQSLFRRNWGPKCVAPKTEKDPACSALLQQAKVPVGVYPADLQGDDSFCQALGEHPEAKALLNPFTVVRKEAEKLVAVPLPQAYGEKMQAVAAELRAAADAMTDPAEEPLRAYLRAAAQSFTDNNWEPADEAWSKMNAQNSKWYVRVGPDEVYWDPCSQKAGMHLTFARINPDSLRWQEKLTPVRQEMEAALATLIGKPYKARKVTFHLPDFIDIVFNAGDDRDPMGATIGQSLPNWGPVANEGRGRTVAMSNLYADPDSLKNRRTQAASLLSQESMGAFSDSTQPGLLSTILHEAAHNLGPAHEYKVKGKTDDQIFGGPLASTMEELKAQTAALWYVDMLAKKGIITEQEARETYSDSIFWALAHIARGMYDGAGRPKPYSQLAAVQVGFLMNEGAITFDPQMLAANGADQGAFTLHFDKMPAAVEKLMKLAGQIKAKGDKKGAEKLVKTYVDGQVVPFKEITERVLRLPKASFVYSFDM